MQASYLYASTFFSDPPLDTACPSLGDDDALD